MQYISLLSPNHHLIVMARFKRAIHRHSMWAARLKRAVTVFGGEMRERKE